MKKRFISVLLAVGMVFGLLPAAVGADGGITYLDWDDGRKELVENTCGSATKVESDTAAWHTGWYVVSGNVTVSSRIILISI